MAYAKKNVVDYFPHAVNHGRKMFIVRNQFGNDGYCIWFMLLEQLGKAHNHFLNLSEPTQMLYLTAEFKVDKNTFLDVVNTLVDLEEFDRELWEKYQVIFSKKFFESVQDVYKRRTNTPLTRNEIFSQFSESCNHDVDDITEIESKTLNNETSNEEIPQSKVNKSKEDERKVDNEEKNIRFLPPTINEIYEHMISKNASEEVAKKESEKMWFNYDSKNWMVGKVKMKNWKSAATGWLKRMHDFQKGKNNGQKLLTDSMTKKAKRYD